MSPALSLPSPFPYPSPHPPPHPLHHPDKSPPKSHPNPHCHPLAHCSKSRVKECDSSTSSVRSRRKEGKGRSCEDQCHRCHRCHQCHRCRGFTSVVRGLSPVPVPWRHGGDGPQIAAAEAYAKGRTGNSIMLIRLGLMMGPVTMNQITNKPQNRKPTNPTSYININRTLVAGGGSSNRGTAEPGTCPASYSA